MLWSPSWLSPVALPTSYSAFPSIGPVQPPFLTYTSVFFHLLFLLPPKLCSRPYPTCLLSAFKSQTSLPESPSCTSHPNGTPQNHSILSCNLIGSDYSFFKFQIRYHIISSIFSDLFFSISIRDTGFFYCGEKVTPLPSIMIYICLLYNLLYSSVIYMLTSPAKLWGLCFVGLSVLFIFVFTFGT